MPNTVRIPREMDSLVIGELNAFLMALSHLPTEAQIDVLGQATTQIVEGIEGVHTSL